MNQSEIEAITCNHRQAREIACEKETVDFGLTSHWLRKWLHLVKPITKRGKTNPKPGKHR